MGLPTSSAIGFLNPKTVTGSTNTPAILLDSNYSKVLICNEMQIGVSSFACLSYNRREMQIYPSNCNSFGFIYGYKLALMA